jgi:aminopeptidase N
VVNDEEAWWSLVRDFYQQFKYKNILTEDVVRFVNARLKRDLTPIFDQYLRRAAIPTLDLAFNQQEGTMAYRWKAEERAFAMPVRVGIPGSWTILEPTTDWKTMRSPLPKEMVEVATDLYYVNVEKN